MRAKRNISLRVLRGDLYKSDVEEMREYERKRTQKATRMLMVMVTITVASGIGLGYLVTHV